MKTPDLNDYISAQKQNRELVLIKRLFLDSELAGWIGPQLRLDLPYVWLGINIPHKRLLRGCSHLLKKFSGDVDVFGATLEFAPAEEYERLRAEVYGAKSGPAFDMIRAGKVRWPPDLSYIAAVEVKAAYY